MMKKQKTFNNCFIIPVLPGQLGLLKNFFSGANGERSREADEHMRKLGIARYLAFSQCLPKGDFLVQYIESKEGIGKTLRDCGASGYPFSSHMINTLKDISGMDFTQIENMPRVEPLFEWKDRKDRGDRPMTSSVFAVPVLPDKTHDVKRYWSDTGGKRLDESEDHFRMLDVRRVNASLQHLPQGEFMIIFIESSGHVGDILIKAMSMDTPRSRFVKEEFMKISGLDFTDPKNSPIIELLMDWDASKGFETVEAQMAMAP
jgi:hypothetical protein